MSLRQWFNENPGVTTGIAVAAVVISLGVVVWQMRGSGPRGGQEVYYWDMQTHTAYIRSPVEVPPVEAPSGGEGVRAHLYSCGECAPGEWFGYLEKYTDDARRHYEQTAEMPGEQEQLVRAVDGAQWVLYHSREGQANLDAIYAVYDDENAAPCGEPGLPPRQCLP